MCSKDPGCTMLELAVLSVALGIVAAVALPQALPAVKACRPPADAAAVARGPAIDLSGVCVKLSGRRVWSGREQSQEELRQRRYPLA